MQSTSKERNLFVILLNYVKPLEEVGRFREAHRTYLKHYYEQGYLLVSGAQEPRVGGVILAQAESKAQIQSIIAGDPFFTEGIAEYTVVEFHPSTYAAGFEQFLA